MKRTIMRKNEDGAVLVTVLAVMMVMFIMVGAAVSYVQLTAENTYKTFQSEQAYMTASTCLESFVNQIEKDTATVTDDAGKAAQKAAIDQLVALADTNAIADVQVDGSTEFARMGSCTIQVSHYGTGTGIIVVTSTAVFGSQEEQVAAYIKTDSKNKKATLDNCIELTGSGDASYDNLNIVGDMASIEGSGSSSRVFTLKNDTKVYGSMFFYGTLKDSSANSGMTFQQSISDSSVGATMTVSENLISSNMTLGAAIPRAEGYNYTNVGGYVKVTNHMYVGTKDKSTKAIFDVDLYCTAMYMNRNGYTQYGNLYVYKNGAGTNGNLEVNGGHNYVYGDVYVEGDLKVINGDLTVYGNVYCSGTVSGNVKTYEYSYDSSTYTQTIGSENTSTACKSGVAITKAGRAFKPEITTTMNEYVYYPEDMLMNNDKDVGKLKTQYTAFYDGTNTKTVGDFVTDSAVTISEDGVSSTYAVNVTESCTLDLASISKLRSKIGNNAKILITVKSSDIIIRLSNDIASLGADNSINIIVKNDSPKTEKDEKFCYFVSDSGLGTIGSIDSTTGKSTHSGFATPTYSNSSWVVLSYSTYKEMFASKLSSACGTLQSPDSSFALNPTSEDIPGATKPANGEIIFLMTQGTSFKATNNPLFEATFYAPQATVDLATGGITIPSIYISKTEVMNSIGTCLIGAIVAESFGSENKAFYVYNKPSDNSVLSISKGAKDDTLNGYKLLRFGHY